MRPIEKKALAKIAKTTNPKQLKAMMCEAASKGWCEVVRELLGQGIPVDAQQSNLSALGHAAMHGRDYVEVVQILLEAGANPKLPGIVENCGVESLPLLLAAGAQVDGHPKRDNPLRRAITHFTQQDKALALLEAGADINVTDPFGMTLLMHAVLNGRDQICQALLIRGADHLAVDATGRTALRHGLETLCHGNAVTETDKRRVLPIVKLLAEKLPGQPEDVLLTDIVLGNETSLEQRLQHGVNANTTIRGSIGLAGLSRETWQEQLDLSHAFPSLPSHVTADASAIGSPLLLWAVAANQEACVQKLLQHGADPKKANADGISAV